MRGKPGVPTSTKFYGKIIVYRYEDAWNPEITETYSESFEATSIQSAKAKLTKIANEQELFSWVQSWDNEKRTYTGKDLRWKPWSPPVSYEQKDSSRYEKRTYTGKDLRKTKENGNPGVRPSLTSKKTEPLSVIAPATLRENSARPFIPQRRFPSHKYGKSVEYRVDLTVYWRRKTKENTKG